MAQVFKMDRIGLEIEAKKENCYITDNKSIIFHLRAFHIFIKNLVFWLIWITNNKFSLLEVKTISINDVIKEIHQEFSSNILFEFSFCPAFRNSGQVDSIKNTRPRGSIISVCISLRSKVIFQKQSKCLCK